MFIRLDLQTRSKVDLIEITDQVKAAIAGAGIEDGICFIYCPHTTAGIVLNEGWDPTVESDLALVLDRIVPESLPYRHSEGNSSAHIKAMLVGNDHFIFVQAGELARHKPCWHCNPCCGATPSSCCMRPWPCLRRRSWKAPAHHHWFCLKTIARP